MPLEKPKKPTELIPRAFGGIKNNFSDDLQATGFEPNIPQTYNGDNLNYHLDATGKELDYVEKVVDFINQAPVNHAVFVNENNQLDYVNKDELGGGGLEIGDIGIAPLGIDETKGKRRYLNGQIIIQEQYTVFTEKLKTAKDLYPTLVCTEEEWQTIATMSVGGQVGKFVVDDEAGIIRLPKIIMPIQGLTNLSKLAEIVEAGIPDIQATVNPIVTENTIYSSLGAIRTDMGGQNFIGDTGTKYWDYAILNFKASWSNSIYGKSNTVQQEQIQYPYFIQVATGSSTSADFSNELQLNNPKVLLESKYFNPEIYNASWLIANGSFNGSNAVHPSVYQALLIEHNPDIAVGTTSESGYTKRGLSVKLSTDTDISEYDFVLNTTDETFRLPIFDGSEEATTTNFQNFALGDSGNSYIAPANGWFSLNITGKNARMYTSALSVGTSSGDSSDKNTQIYIKVSRGERVYVKYGSYTAVGHFRFVYAKGNGSLYYFVGSALQNTGIVNVGRIEEKVATLIPDNSSLISSYAMPSNKYTSLTIGASGSEYTAPANGYYTLHRAPSSGLGTITLTNTSNNIRSCCETNVGYGIRVFIPVAKGQIIRMHYNTTTWNTSVDYFGFVYAIGSESEAN